jgi:CBS domain containing-hemolysin-like protein
MLTREIGKIPELGETFEFPNFEVEILDADETRVQSVKIKLKKKGS